MISTVLILIAAISFYFLKKFDVIECKCCMMEWNHNLSKQCRICQDLFKTKKKDKTENVEMKIFKTTSNSFDSFKSDYKPKSNDNLNNIETISKVKLNHKRIP